MMIRARSMMHLQNLKARFAILAESEILALLDREYKWRLIVPKDAWVIILAELAREQNWSDFRGEAAHYRSTSDPAYSRTIDRVWRVMADFGKNAGVKHDKKVWRRKVPEKSETRECFRGCLLGGAVGDALGAPVEFMSGEQIVDRFGESGIREYVPSYGRIGAITDDTQMALFTAEGMLRAWVRLNTRGIGPAFQSVVAHAYLRWLRTQGEQSKSAETFSKNPAG